MASTDRVWLRSWRPMWWPRRRIASRRSSGLLPPLGFFTNGMFALFTLWLPELFPTAQRSFGAASRSAWDECSGRSGRPWSASSWRLPGGSLPGGSYPPSIIAVSLI